MTIILEKNTFFTIQFIKSALKVLPHYSGIKFYNNLPKRLKGKPIKRDKPCKTQINGLLMENVYNSVK